MTGMIRVSVEVRDGAVTRRVQITAPSIERALEIAGARTPALEVRLLFPIDPGAFVVPEGASRRGAA
jgi:hypothetical protein